MKWVVGQEVCMRSGCYTRKGWVVRVAPSGVEVQTGVMQNDGTWNAHELEHFDSDGKGLGEGMYECGPWELHEAKQKQALVPFAGS